MQCRSSSAVFLRIRSVRILDSIVCSRPLVWLFSPAWDAVKLACQKAVFIFPGHRRATTVVLQDECLTPFYLSPTQNILPFYPIGIKASCVCVLVTRSHLGKQQRTTGGLWLSCTRGHTLDVGPRQAKLCAHVSASFGL